MLPKLCFGNNTIAESNDWNPTTLGKVVKMYLGLTYTPTYTKVGIPFLSAKDIKNNKILFDDKKFISKEEFENSSDNAKPQKGDILFARVGTLGNPVIIDFEQEFCIFVSLGYFRIFNPEISKEFICQWMKSNKFTKQVDSQISGSSQKNLNIGWLKKFKINIPSIVEQQKIGHFLNLLDSRIGKQQEKVEAWREYKKGMMQKLFSRELRFKDEDGQEYPEWGVKSFGKLSKKVGPKNKGSLDYPAYSISNKHGFILQSEQFEESRLEDLDKSSYKIVKNGQFAYNPARINVGSIGLSRINEPVIVSSLYVCFELVNSMSNEFVNQYFTTYRFNKEVLRNVEGSVREYLFYDNFSNIRIDIPSLLEQRKIANFLSEIDNKIQKEELKLNTLNEQKKGLMQQMFI